MLKLSMSISKPALTLPATRLSNSFRMYADRGPRTKAARIMTCPPNGSTEVPSPTVTGSAAATTAPKVATAPMTAPRWPWTIRPPV